MKTRLQTLSAFILLMAVIASCSVQKRRYARGWHVEWTSAHAKANKTDTHRDEKPIKAYSPGISSEIAASIASKKESAPVITAEAATPAPSQPNSAPQAAPVKKAMQSALHAVSAPLFRPIEAQQRASDGPDDGTDSLGLLSFIFAMVGLVTGVGFLLALIFGSIALNRYRAGMGTPSRRGFAAWGYIIGLIGVILYTLLLLLIIAVA